MKYVKLRSTFCLPSRWHVYVECQFFLPCRYFLQELEACKDRFLDIGSCFLKWVRVKVERESILIKQGYCKGSPSHLVLDFIDVLCSLQTKFGLPSETS